MARIVQETRIDLADRELLALDRVQGHVLACRSGELWITLDGSQEDIILGPGQRWRVTSNHPVVVSALKPAVLIATHPRGHAPCSKARAWAGSILTALLRLKRLPLVDYSATLPR